MGIRNSHFLARYCILHKPGGVMNAVSWAHVSRGYLNLRRCFPLFPFIFIFILIFFGSCFSKFFFSHVLLLSSVGKSYRFHNVQIRPSLFCRKTPRQNYYAIAGDAHNMRNWIISFFVFTQTLMQNAVIHWRICSFYAYSILLRFISFCSDYPRRMVQMAMCYLPLPVSAWPWNAGQAA